LDPGPDPPLASDNGGADLLPPDQAWMTQRSGRRRTRVDISANLASDLALLSQSLDGGRVDLESALRALSANLALAAPSYHGLTMTIALESHDVSFTVRQPGGVPVVGASLRIPLAAVTPAGGDSALVLYAAAPGAFVDLAADLAHALGVKPAALVLDGHLAPPDASTELTGLGAHMAVNQAIGVLIERGHTQASADLELRRLAGTNGGSLHTTASALIREIPGR
jgi:hypothetical protein